MSCGRTFLVAAAAIAGGTLACLVAVERLTRPAPPGHATARPPPAEAVAPSAVELSPAPPASPAAPVAVAARAAHPTVADRPRRAATFAPPAPAAPPAAGTDTDGRATLQISFQLDPRVTGGIHLGKRWVSPPRYTSTRSKDGAGVSVAARARLVGADGKALAAAPAWEVADPGMVAVWPPVGDEVEIAVRRAGRSAVTVTAGGARRALTVVARGQPLAVEISQ